METIENSRETLEDVLHHFMTLNERFDEERQIMAKQNAELGKLVVRLSAQIEKLKEADNALRMQVSQSIGESALTMANKTAEAFKKAAMSDVEQAARELKRSALEHTQTLQQWDEQYAVNSLIARMAFFVLPIVVSLLIFWLLSPRPFVPLTNEQLVTYERGRDLETVWPKLNQKQRSWFKGLVEREQ